jgi:hypothetical protein
MGCKNLFLKNKEERFSPNIWFIEGLRPPFQTLYQKHSLKKEDIKMDEQKKIKILKYFDHGLQKPFSKNKEERFIKKILSKKGR